MSQCWCSHLFSEIHLPKNASKTVQHCIDHAGLVAIDHSGSDWARDSCYSSPRHCHACLAHACLAHAGEMVANDADGLVHADPLVFLNADGLLPGGPTPSFQFWLLLDFLSLMAFRDMNAGMLRLQNEAGAAAAVEAALQEEWRPHTLAVIVKKHEEENAWMQLELEPCWETRARLMALKVGKVRLKKILMKQQDEGELAVVIVDDDLVPLAEEPGDCSGEGVVVKLELLSFLCSLDFRYHLPLLPLHRSLGGGRILEPHPHCVDEEGEFYSRSCRKKKETSKIFYLVIGK